MNGGRKVEDWRNGMRSEEKRMKGMEGTRVLGSTQPPKLKFSKPNYSINIKWKLGQWLGFNLGPNWCQNGQKISKNGCCNSAVRRWTRVYFLKFDGRIVIMTLVLNWNSEIRGPFLTFSKSVPKLHFSDFAPFFLTFSHLASSMFGPRTTLKVKEEKEIDQLALKIN